MDEQEARLILQASRPGDVDLNDPQVAAALQLAEQNPELVRWRAEEEAFDRAMAAHLAAMPTPFGLKTRLLAEAAPSPAPSRWLRWIFSLAGVAAVLFLLLQVADFWRYPAPSEKLVSEWSSEMVSFIKISPPLEMESDNLGAIKDWVAEKKAAPVPADVPPQIAALQPVGCRVLSFRGHEVTLICFDRGDDRLAHLFTVDRAVLPELQPGAAPVYSSSGEWVTASWAEGNRAYMVTVQGDRAALQRFLPSA